MYVKGANVAHLILSSQTREDLVVVFCMVPAQEESRSPVSQPLFSTFAAALWEKGEGCRMGSPDQDAAAHVMHMPTIGPRSSLAQVQWVRTCMHSNMSDPTTAFHTLMS